MIEKLMAYCSNYFAVEKYHQRKIQISEGKITLNFQATVSAGNYLGIARYGVIEVYEITEFESGVATVGIDSLEGDGYLLLLKPPIGFVELSKRIGDFETENKVTAYQSEAIPNYSYSTNQAFIDEGSLKFFEKDIARFKSVPISIERLIYKVEDYGIK